MHKTTILLVEDNPLQARNTKNILEKAGYSVIVTETGGEGFKEAKLSDIDLVLLDLVLPDYSGEKICQWIKRDMGTRDLPIIMLTAKATIKEKVAGLEVGADDYLTKPFAEEELLARMKTLLRIKRLQDELRAKNMDLERALKEVEIKAITDPGTGLFNRRHFFDLLEKEFTRAKRFSEPLSCLLIDIDHFKLVNDTYGHHIGDSVLSEISEILRGAVRLIEVAARYGGEEFVMLLPRTPPEEAHKPAERIRESIAGHKFKGLPPSKKITISIGISGIPDEDIIKKDDLVRCADLALYKAKNNGRNRIEISKGADLDDF